MVVPAHGQTGLLVNLMHLVEPVRDSPKRKIIIGETDTVVSLLPLTHLYVNLLLSVRLLFHYINTYTEDNMLSEVLVTSRDKRFLIKGKY